MKINKKKSHFMKIDSTKSHVVNYLITYTNFFFKEVDINC